MTTPQVQISSEMVAAAARVLRESGCGRIAGSGPPAGSGDPENGSRCPFLRRLRQITHWQRSKRGKQAAFIADSAEHAVPRCDGSVRS